jgi:hypothetical protein
VTVQCDKQIRRERGTKDKEISYNRNVSSFDSNVKRSVSTRVNFEGITAITNQEFQSFKGHIFITEALQRDVKHGVSVVSARKDIGSGFDEEADHGWCVPTGLPSAIQFDEYVRRETGAKGKKISCNRDVAPFDTNMKRSVSTRIGLKGITAITDEAFYSFQGLVFIIQVQGLQQGVKRRISIDSAGKNIESVFDEEVHHALTQPDLQCGK